MDINNIGNDELKKFLVAIGSLTEIWMFTYQNFMKQGLNKDDALEHTQAFMAVYMGTTFGNTKNEE